MTTTARKSKIKHGIEDIGAEQAYALLAQMPSNRRISQIWVNTLARDMLAGAWIAGAGDPIRVDEDGNLIDGQHRLWAVIESKTSHDFVVHRNLPVESLWVIDTGRSRTLRDFLMMKKENNVSALSTAIKLFIVYERKQIVAYSGAATPSIQECLATLERHPNLRASTTATQSVNRSVKGGHGLWTTAHYILASINESDTQDFIAKISTGENLGDGSPLLALRRRLIDDASSLRHLAPIERSALIFKAWNLYRTGATATKVLSWRGGGANPEAYPVPE